MDFCKYSHQTILSRMLASVKGNTKIVILMRHISMASMATQRAHSNPTDRRHFYYTYISIILKRILITNVNVLIVVHVFVCAWLVCVCEIIFTISDKRDVSFFLDFVFLFFSATSFLYFLKRGVAGYCCCRHGLVLKETHSLFSSRRMTNAGIYTCTHCNIKIWRKQDIVDDDDGDDVVCVAAWTSYRRWLAGLTKLKFCSNMFFILTVVHHIYSRFNFSFVSLFSQLKKCM